MAADSSTKQQLSEFVLGQRPKDDVCDSLLSHINTAFQAGDKAASDLPFNDLWRALILSGRDTRADDAGQDRLVELLRDIQNKGTLKDKNGKVCETSLGTAWTDLPGLGSQMRHIWNDAPPTMSVDQWANINSLAARLTASQIHDFSLFAIWSLRDALEQERPLTLRQTDDSTRSQKLEDAPVDQLLPGALQWLEHAGSTLVSLTKKGHTYNVAEGQPDPAWLGKLCKDAHVARGGYSVERWRFWEKRLQALSEAHDEAGGREKVAKLAYQGLEKMKSLGKGQLA